LNREERRVKREELEEKGVVIIVQGGLVPNKSRS
jgi:hypothetical protein